MKKMLNKTISLGVFCVMCAALTVTSSAQVNIKHLNPGLASKIPVFSENVFSLPGGSSKVAQTDMGKQLTFSPYFKMYTDYSPDGNWITYAQGNDDGLLDVWIVPVDGDSTTDGGSAVNLTADIQASCVYPVFTPDSQKVLFTQWDDSGDTLWRFNIYTSELTLIRENACYGRFSDNGQYLVYRAGDTGALMLYDIENIKTWVIDEDSFYSLSCFTPDNTHVITTRSDNTLWMIPVAGGEPMPLTPEAGTQWFPDVSPDGQWVMFTIWPVVYFEDAFLAAYHMETGEFLVVYPETLIQNYSGSFSPDGSRFSYLLDIDGYFQVFTADFPFREEPQPVDLVFKYETVDWIGSSAAIDSDGNVYISSGQSLYAINPDGSLKWEYQIEDWFGSSAAIGIDGTVYIVAGTNLYAFNTDGSLKWKSQELLSLFSSPAIGSDGTIYIGSYENYVYAINPDGSLKWEFMEENTTKPSKPIVDRSLNKVAKQAGVGTSSVTIGGDGTIYHGSCGQNVYAINPDGSFKWKFNANLGGWAVSSPAIDSDGTIYVGSGDNNLYAINPDGSLKWEYQTDNWIDSSPSIGDDGTIYIGSWDGNLYAINTDGSHKWKYQTDGGIVSSPAIGSDGTIYIGSWDDSWFGYLYAFNSDGSLKWRYSADTEIMSSPSIDNNGIIYFGSGNYLYAIDSGTSAGLADTPWPKYRHDLQNTGSVQVARELNITSPNGGESLTGGITQNITWTAENVSTIMLEYTTDGGSSWTTIATGVDASAMSYSWTVPPLTSSQCQIRISEEKAGGLSSKSLSNFSIVTKVIPTISLTSPNGGETYIAGKTYTITWKSTGVSEINIVFTADNWDSKTYLATDYDATTGSFEWAVPDDIESSQCLIRISQTGGFQVTDSSDSFFTISSSQITFSDPNLEEAIREELNKSEGALTKEDLAGLTELNAWEWDISDLTGIEHCVNLEWLELSKNQISELSPLSSLTNLGGLRLSENQISDLSPLSSLTNLWELKLFDNQISDLSPLSSLTNLGELGLAHNPISDLSPLSNLTNLQGLYLGGNQISDLSPLSNLTNLQFLTLGENQISDLSPLSRLTNLNELYLGENQISDLSPLSNMTNLQSLRLYNNQISYISPLSNLTNLQVLWLLGNQISDISPLSSLTNLQKLRISGNKISELSPLSGLIKLRELWLHGNQISDISSLINLTDLRVLYLDNNQIQDISPLAGLKMIGEPEGWIEKREGVNIHLGLSDNRISDISPLVNNTGIGENDGIDLRGNPLNNDAHETHIPDLQTRGINVLFDPPGAVTIPDSNLKETIIDELFYLDVLEDPEGPITVEDLAVLTQLDAYQRDISDLTGIEHCVNLQSLYLSDNQISDLSPLSSLTNLTDLYLHNNQISDLSPLSSLTNLNELSLNNNQISDISPLNSLTNLETLRLSANQISDLSPLSSLTNLTDLYLHNNQISDISPLSNLTNLDALSINNNRISDISPLVSNTGIGEGDGIDLRGNPLNNEAHETHIPALQARGVNVLFDPKSEEKFITLLSPQSGDYIPSGTDLEIRWEAQDVSTIDIDITFDGWQTSTIIAENVDASLGSVIYTLPETVNSNNCYVWIGASDDESIEAENEEPFTVAGEAPEPIIQLDSPIGGEVWEAGSEQIITWEAAGVSQVNIQYSLDGINYMIIEKNVDAATGSYEWIVPPLPAGSTGSDMCFIRIIDSSNFNIRAMNPSAFTILAPIIEASIELITPNGGDQWAADSFYTIVWQSTGVSLVDIEYSTDGGDIWDEIAYGVDAGSGSLGWWIPPDINSTNCLVRITDTDNKDIEDISETAFTIFVGEAEAYIEVIFPNGGDELLVGELVDIIWVSNAVEEVRIAYLTEEGGTWKIIESRTPAYGGVFEWQVPDEVSDYCVIKIIDVSSGLFDESDEPFRILPNITNENAVFSIDTNLDLSGHQYNAPVIGISGSELVAFAIYGHDWVSPNMVHFTMNWDPGSAIFREDRSFLSTNGEVVNFNGLSITLPNEVNIMGKFGVTPNFDVQVPQTGTFEGTFTLTESVEPLLESGLVYLAVFETSSEFSIEDSLIVYVNMEIFDDTGSKNLGQRRFRAHAAYSYVDLTYPVGGEQWAAGSTQTIEWESEGVTNVDILFSWEGWDQEIWLYVTDNTDAKQGYFEWEVPEDIESSVCLIAIRNLDDLYINDASDLFTVYKETQEIRLVSPNGGQEWAVRSEETISWVSSGISLVNIEYSTDGGSTWKSIYSGEDASKQSYTWKLPDDVSSDCKVRISDVANSNLNDVSDAKFAIVASDFISVTEPSAGETWSIGIEYEIKWDYSNIDNIKIELSTDGGLTWNDIEASISASEGSHRWVVLDMESSECIIKLTDVANTSILDESDLFSIIKPQISIEHECIAEAEENVEITFDAVVKSDSEIMEVKIYYDETGDRVFDNHLVMNPKQDQNFEAILEEGTFTALGMEYYITAKDVDGKEIRSPVGVSYHVVSALVNDIKTEAPVPAGTEQTSYRMVSIPLELKETNIEDQLRDKLPPGEIGVDWRIFRYPPGSDTPEEYPNIEEGFAPGIAFWIIAKDGYDLEAPQGTTVSTAESFKLSLKSGWNDIANPWMFDISWDDIENPSGAELSVLYSYENKWSDPTGPPTTMKPWKGYAVKNLSNRTVIIKLQPKPAGAAKPVIDAHPEGWKLTIRATAGLAVDSANHLGVRPDASEEWDRYDHVEPPPVGQYVSVLFPHNDWAKYPCDYTVDFRPPDETVSWDFVIKTNITSEIVFVEFDGIDDLPEGYRVSLFDRENGMPMDISGRSFDFKSGNNLTQRHFTLVVTTNGENEQDETGTQPSQFVTAACYPNPFNPQTTIRYELSMPGRVNITVFNAIGQKMREYDLGFRAQGIHEFVFEAGDFTTGLYIYMVKTGYAVATEKMLFMK